MIRRWMGGYRQTPLRRLSHYQSSGCCPETGLEEINADLPEADFWLASVTTSHGMRRRQYLQAPPILARVRTF